LGKLDINIQATGDNCLGIAIGATTLSDDLCTKKSLTLNPAIETDPRTFDVKFNGNKAGTTVVTTEFCIKGTNKCIKKAAKIEIIADPLFKATINTASEEVIAGGEVPLSVQ